MRLASRFPRSPVTTSRAFSTILAALLVAASSRGQSLVQSIPPPSVPVIGTLQGVMGFCVVGDVDGDGTPDFATGHPTSLLLLGRVRLQAGLTGSLLGERTGASLGLTNQNGFGQWLETLGDVSGDGIPEFMAGIAGTFYAVPGQVAILSPAGMSLILMLTGSQPGDEFGLGLGGFSDVNGDGVPDPLVGAPSAAPSGLTFAGEVRAFDLSTGSSLFNLTGSAVGDGLGARFARMGDLDGDGMDDFAVDHFLPSWEALVVSGGTGQTLYSIAGPGFVSDDMASIADLDFDGARELATRSANGGLDAITVFSWGSPLLTYTAAPFNSYLSFANSLDSAGDVDGDGFEDIVAGAPVSAPPGGGYIGYGAVVVVSGATGELLQEMYGGTVGSGMGNLVRGAGDVNVDGLSDIGVWNAGRLEIWSLVPSGSTIDGQACTGASGMSPAIGVTGSPSLGGAFTVNLSRVPAGGTAILLSGPPLASWNGIPLPLDLAVVGLPGCSLSVPLAGLAPRPVTPRPGTAVGVSDVRMAIPADYSIGGASVAFQWYAPDPAPGVFPGVTTRRLVVTIP